MSKEYKYSNKDLVAMLKEVLAAMEVKEVNRFRIRAYQNAISSIENLTTSVYDMWEDARVSDINGVGSGLSQHINELFTKGKVEDWIDIKKDLPSGMFPLIKLRGVGSKTAYKLATEFELDDPDEALDKVKKAAEKGKIAEMSGFGDKSEKDILDSIVDLKQSKNEKQRTLLYKGEQISKRVIKHLKKLDSVSKALPLGSLRRRAPTIGDIDIAVASNSPSEVIEHFTTYKEVKEIISKGDKMASVILATDMQVDLLVIEEESFGSMLQHFTGSKQHNVLLRTYSLNKNLSLSQYGIKKVGGASRKKFSDEKNFYNYLGLDWIPPEIREGNEEIERAQKSKLPNLIELKDIKGDIHMHTVFSDGNNTLDEMVNKAKELGYSYIGISDHAPSVNSRGSYEVLGIIEKTKSKIGQINSSQKQIRVLYGYEINILADKTVSMPDNMMEKLDYVIASIHTSFDQQRDHMTERLLNAIKNPYVNVIGHPTGRLINERENIDLDWDKIFDAVLEHDKVLEINSQPSRLDLPEDLVKRAIDMGIKLIINTDAHVDSDLELMKYGIDVARRGWCEKANIINTLPYDEFIKQLKARV